MKLIVAVVHHGSDAAQQAPPAAGGEERHPRVIKKRVPGAVQFEFDVADQRRHPEGVVLVNLPRKADKSVYFLSAFDGFNLKVMQGHDVLSQKGCR